MALWAQLRAGREQEARNAWVRSVLARNAAEDQGRTLREVLTGLAAADDHPVCPRFRSRHVWVGTGQPGEPWAMFSH
jgi:hypothetical protein